MKDKILRILQPSFIAAVFFRGGGVILSFLLNVVLARKYGAELSGEYYALYNFLSLAVTIAFMGFSYVVVHRITPYYTGVKNEMNEKGNVLLSLSVYVLIANSVVLAVLMIILSRAFSIYLCGDESYKAGVMFSAIGMLPFVASSFLSELFKALKKPNYSIMTINVMINGIMILIILFNPYYSVNVLLMSFAISNAVTFFAMLLSGTKMFALNGVALYSPAKTIIEVRSNRELCHGYFKENLQLSIVSISNAVLSVFDTLVISNLLTAVDVAMFNVANKVVSFGSIILTTVNTLIGFKISELSYKDDNKKLKTVFISYTKVLMVLAFAYYVAAVGFSFCIPLLFGDEYGDSIKLGILLAIGQFITIFTGPCAYFLIMTGRTKTYQKIVIATAALTIVLNYVLVSMLGIMGSVVSNIAILTFKNVVTFVFATKYLNIKIRDFFGGVCDE